MIGSRYLKKPCHYHEDQGQLVVGPHVSLHRGAQYDAKTSIGFVDFNNAETIVAEAHVDPHVDPTYLLA